MPYQPVSRGGVFIDLGGYTTDFALLDELTSSGISHNPPDTPAADPSMSLYAKARVAVTSGGTPGTATYGFEPSDAMAAWRDLRGLQGELDKRTVREEQGLIRHVINGTSTSVFSAALGSPASDGSATATFAGSAMSQVDIRTDANWDTGLLVVVGANAFVIEELLTATTAKVRRSGAMASNVVTPDAAAIAQAAAAAASLYEFAVRRQFNGTMNSLSPSGSATDRTAEVVFQLDAFETERFLLADGARTVPVS